jgi:hypothetical protein
MKASSVFLFSLLTLFISASSIAQSNADTFATVKGTAILPNVFTEPHGDLIESKLRQEAVLQFPLFQLPRTKNEWNTYRVKLRDEIIKKTSALVHQNLPLNLKETGSVKMKGYTIKNIAFQTRPGIYATENFPL